jgi:hypothetical protein
VEGDKTMNIIGNEAIEDINENLKVIWQRLEGFEHYLQMMAEYGVLSRDVEEVIIVIAISISKPLNKKYTEQLRQESVKV